MSQMCPSCSFDNADSAKTCTRCAAPLRHLLGENVLLGERYQLVSVLGCGAMGAVYLANDQRLKGRRCAIKENLPDPTAPVNVQEQSREQFLAEASILARLDHPNLPKVSDYFIEDGREYLVMDYVEGEDLESRMTRTKQALAEKNVIGWADQVLDALTYLHNQKPQPIIHRDIKPANLRVDLYNRVKLVDFGLVKLFDADSPETKAELRGVGTPAYAPLEQFAGSDEHTDPRSDIYALGATLYHLLTNTPPVEVHRRLLKPESLTKPRVLNPVLSEATADVIMRAIEIYPDDRYQSAVEMRAALNHNGQQVAPVVGPGSQPATATAPPSKIPPAVLWFGLVGLLLVLGILGFMAFSLYTQENATATATQRSIANQTSTIPTSTLLPTATATNTPTRVVENATATPFPATPTAVPIGAITATPTETLTATPQPQLPAPNRIPAETLQGTIAYPVFNGDSYNLYFGQADGSDTRFFRANASQPAFSPDGSRIAIHSWSLAQRGLVTLSAAGGNGTLVSNFVEDQLPTWSLDGSQITFLTRRTGERKSELLRVGSAAEMGQPTFVGEGEYPTIGADGQLYFKGWGNTGTGLRRATANLGDIQVLTDNDQDTAPAPSPDGSQIAFMSRRDGNWEIYVVDADGSNLQRLTDDPANDGLPTWSPDGEAIAFVSNREGQWAVWAMTPTGADQQQLFEMQGSPDGFVGTDPNASRGWAEERISWSQ